MDTVQRYTLESFQRERKWLDLTNSFFYVDGLESYSIGKKEVYGENVVDRISETEFVTFKNVCTHRGITFSDPKGVIKQEPGVVTCPWHGMKFSTLDGKQVGGSVKCSSLRMKPLHYYKVIPNTLFGEALPKEVLDIIGDRQWEYFTNETSELDVNWKIPVETFAENLHIPFIHKDLSENAHAAKCIFEEFPWGQIQTTPLKSSEYYQGKDGDECKWIIVGANIMIEVVGHTMVISVSMPMENSHKKSLIGVFFYFTGGVEESRKWEFVRDFMKTIKEDDQLSQARQDAIDIIAANPHIVYGNMFHNLEAGLMMYRRWYERVMRSV